MVITVAGIPNLKGVRDDHCRSVLAQRFNCGPAARPRSDPRRRRFHDLAVRTCTYSTNCLCEVTQNQYPSVVFQFLLLPTRMTRGARLTATACTFKFVCSGGDRRPGSTRAASFVCLYAIPYAITFAVRGIPAAQENNHKPRFHTHIPNPDRRAHLRPWLARNWRSRYSIKELLVGGELYWLFGSPTFADSLKRVQVTKNEPIDALAHVGSRRLPLDPAPQITARTKILFDILSVRSND
jgi:hypothetical protein